MRCKKEIMGLAALMVVMFHFYIPFVRSRSSLVFACFVLVLYYFMVYRSFSSVFGLDFAGIGCFVIYSSFSFAFWFG